MQGQDQWPKEPQRRHADPETATPARHGFGIPKVQEEAGVKNSQTAKNPGATDLPWVRVRHWRALLSVKQQSGKYDKDVEPEHRD